jgi:hypothetical protein
LSAGTIIFSDSRAFLSGTSFNMLFTYSLQVVEHHGLKPSQC